MRLKIILLIFLGSISLVSGCSPNPKERGNATPENADKPRTQIKAMADINSGYAASRDDWISFLGCWRQSVDKRLQSKAGAMPMPASVNRLPSPDDKLIETNAAAIEKRQTSTGLIYPKSFKDFFAVTGGAWLVERSGAVNTDGISTNFSGIDAIGVFKDVDKVNWDSWHRAMGNDTIAIISPELNYRYGYIEKKSDRQDDAQFRWEQIGGAIKVGELRQGTVILLNPKEVTQDGEWEAWILSPSMGANRYRSFAELMQHVAYQNISAKGGVSFPASELRGSCARFLKTVATN